MISSGSPCLPLLLAPAAMFWGVAFDCVQDCFLFSLEVGGSVTAGIDLQCILDDKGRANGTDWIRITHKTAERIMAALPLHKYFRDAEYDQAVARVSGVSNEMIDKYRVTYQELMGPAAVSKSASSSSGDDVDMGSASVMRHMLQYVGDDAARDARYHVTEEELLGNVRGFIQAGIDTLGGTLAFLMYELGSHPAVQARLYKELCTVMAGALSDGHEDPLLVLTADEFDLRSVFPLHTAGDFAQTLNAAPSHSLPVLRYTCL